MKVYICPTDANTLAAVTIEPDQILITLAHEGIPQMDAVFMLRDRVQAQPFGPHKVLWVDDPQAHPDLAAALDRLSEPPDDAEQDHGVELCTSCAHQIVCGAANEARRLGAEITRCPEHVAMPQEENP